jgi:hypothetical protein
MLKKEDIEMGNKNESETIDVIDKTLETTLIKDEDKFSIFDWHNKDKTIFVELKSRRLYKDKYPTTMIGTNKIKFCNDTIKSYYFFFKFFDGLYYIKYDKDLFKDFDIKYNVKINYRNDVNKNEFRDFIYIPVNKLLKI